MRNRRIFERFGSDMIFWLKLPDDQEMHPFEVENISAGGVRLCSEQKLNPGTEITLEFELPQCTDLIHAKAVVRHVEDEGGSIKAGVEFTSVEELTGAQLVEYLEEIFK